MENTIDRIITKEELQRLSLYLEYVKRNDVEFFNKLIKIQNINFNELKYSEDMVSPIFMKEALIYNIYNCIMRLVHKLNEKNIYFVQNFQNQEEESANYYLSIFDNDKSEKMLLELIVPANLENNPLSVFLYDNPSNVNLIDNFLKFYNINSTDLKPDEEEQMVLSRRYPKENPLVVIKKI
ncbi:MAG: hypothetical protein E7158_04815 [Firmicutes bacterium]|nr:hypothetical protein [Bacillota bacterium]